MQNLHNPSERSKVEPLFFTILLIISLIPLLLQGHFITLDGPAHLYNSRLIRELLAGNSLVQSFFSWNPIPEPNWSGHFLMALFGSFLSAEVTMKLIIALILVTTATGFRRLFIQMAPESAWCSWLIFPWLYHFPLMMGFLNYSIGLALFPWIISIWQQSETGFSATRNLLLFVMLTFSYFSHLMLFAITFLAMGMTLLYRNNYIKRAGWLALISAPFIAAGFMFILNRGTTGMHGSYNRLSTDELLLNFASVRPLIIFHMDNERPTGIAYGIFLAFLLIIAFLRPDKEKFFRNTGLFTLVMIGLYFLFPDDFAAGGIISVRIAQLAFIGILWMVACARLSPGMQKIAAAGSVIFSVLFYSLHHETHCTLSADATNYASAASSIPEGSVVLPLNYSENWLHSNFPGLAGAERNLIVLDNYEADMLYFPLHWKEGLNVKEQYGDYASSKRPCIPFAKLAATQKLPDAILCWQMPDNDRDSCTLIVNQQLLEHYKLKYTNKSAKVYLLNQKSNSNS
jgi:hypothetical protein